MTDYDAARRADRLRGLRPYIDARYRREQSVRWDQRGMAALGIAYVAVLYALDPGHGIACLVLAAVLAIPQAVPRRKPFAVVCAILAWLILALGAAAGVLLAGWFLLWFVFGPTALTLLLARRRVPERWTPFAAPPIFMLTTALLAASAYGLTTV